MNLEILPVLEECFRKRVCSNSPDKAVHREVPLPSMLPQRARRVEHLIIPTHLQSFAHLCRRPILNILHCRCTVTNLAVFPYTVRLTLLHNSPPVGTKLFRHLVIMEGAMLRHQFLIAMLHLSNNAPQCLLVLSKKCPRGPLDHLPGVNLECSHRALRSHPEFRPMSRVARHP